MTDPKGEQNSKFGCLYMYFTIIVFIIHEHVCSPIMFCSLEVGNFVAKVENVVGVYVTLIFVLEFKTSIY